MEIKDSIFVRIKDRRIPLEVIKGYYPIDIQKKEYNKSTYGINLETSKGNLMIDFSTKKERDYTLGNLDKIFSIKNS